MSPRRQTAALLVPLAALALACSEANDGGGNSGDEVGDETGAETGDEAGTWTDTGNEPRQPFRDEWEEVLRGPAEGLELLSIGDRLTQDNFANRGDISVEYVDGDEVVVEMRRFTIAKPDGVENAFSRMQLWAYDQATPSQPTEDMDAIRCFAPGTSSCYVRAYYDGIIQPARDGVDFRVQIPTGWEGDLLLVTEDNLGEGIESYPDRSDVSVAGLAGDLDVDLDSGNVEVLLDPAARHFPGCPMSDAECYADWGACSCSEPLNVTIANGPGQSSNITIDVGGVALADDSNFDKWWTVQLENRGDFSELTCNATIDCAPFDDCAINPDFAALFFREAAEINFPAGPGAIFGAGMRVSAASENCAMVSYINGPEDYESETMPTEKRGELNFCAGCL